MCVERPVKIEWVDAVNAVELVAPLHRVGSHVPETTADVSQRLALAYSRVDLGERGLGEPLFSDVARDEHRRYRYSLALEHRIPRQRDGQRHTVLPQYVSLEVTHPISRHDRFEEVVYRVAVVL